MTNETVVLQDLESVLQKEMGETLTVENFLTKALLQPGENYGSTILSVEAKIKKNKNAELETLHLVAKMLPPTDFQRKLFDSAYTFRKETFLYTDILPFYKKLELDSGIEKSAIFNIGAKFYGARISSSAEEEINEDAVIVLENLKVRGYYTGDRKLGLDLEHAKEAIRAMAKFHALGMVVKYKNPDKFQIFKKRCRCQNYDPKSYEAVQDSILNNLQEDPFIRKYYHIIKPLMDKNFDSEIWTGIPTEPWATIIHADFWVNNMMFHKDSSGQVDDVKFVDFQNYLFQNPLNELLFFIGASVQTDLILENVEILLNVYYENFVAVLKRMGCDDKLFTREDFQEKVKVSASLKFGFCVFLLKIVAIDVETEGVEATVLDAKEFAPVNERFITRTRKLISTFLERGWI